MGRRRSAERRGQVRGARGAQERGGRVAGTGGRAADGVVTAAGECAPRLPREEPIARPVLPVQGQASGEKPGAAALPQVTGSPAGRGSLRPAWVGEPRAGTAASGGRVSRNADGGGEGTSGRRAL